MKEKWDSLLTDVEVPQRPPREPNLSEGRGCMEVQEVPSSTFPRAATNRSWCLLRTAEILPSWVRKICIFAVLTPHMFLSGKIMSAWINGGLTKPPQTFWNSRTNAWDISCLHLSAHKALVKSKSPFPPVSRCKATELINFLVITAQHWGDREAARQMPLGATLTFNCKPREESQCPRSLGLETG